MLARLERALPALAAIPLAFFAHGCDPPGPVAGVPDLDALEDGVVTAGEEFSTVLEPADSAGNVIDWTILDGPETATLEDGVLRWTPGDGDTGDQPFVLAGVRDVPGIHPTFAGLTVVVVPVGLPTMNHPPDAAAVPAQRIEQGQTLTLRLFARDPDGDRLTWKAIFAPQRSMLWPATGVFAWTPGAEDVGTTWAVFGVTDDGVPPMGDYVVFRIDVTIPAY
jgi:hypothetical protein